MDAATTWWTLIEGAVAGDPAARSLFARRYLEVVRGYLASRWRAPTLRQHLDDAVQEAFLEMLREGGALGRAETRGARPFRAFLFGVARNVARRFEERWGRARAANVDVDPAAVASDEEGPSRALDREWARAVVREAGDRHRGRAAALGDDGMRRVEILRLRFQDGLPIREIALRWGADPARLHHEYARARGEFRAALREVVAEHHEGTPDVVDAECERLLELLA
jgi:RNA polymerase sigma-70 factor (ECF subfamily)